jgi:hypothetical protein
MAKRIGGTAAAALALLLAAGTASAQEKKEGPVPAPPPAEKKLPGPVSGDDAAKAAIERFESDFRSRDEGKRMGAIAALGHTKNDLVTKRLATLLLDHSSVDVRNAAATILDGQYQNTALSGEYLRRALVKEKESEVQIAIALSLGRIAYAEAIPDMGEVLKKDDNVFVKIELLKSYGKMKDTRALLPILDLWLVNPQGYSWEGGEVSYDSGAAGDADQKEAERQYKEKYGNQQRKGAPPVMLKTYIQAIADAVFKITGEKLSGPNALVEWLCLHEKELPYPLPGKVKQALKAIQEKAAKKKEKEEKEKKK